MKDQSASASGLTRSTLELWLAFALLYVVWGSTYFAIRIAVRTLPPFTMAGVRFLIAGAVPMFVLRARGEPWPTRIQLRNAAVVGACLMLGGNGLVSWAERTVSSSLAALLVAVTPMWFVILDALRPGGDKPTPRAALGLLIGFIGVATLIGPDNVRHDLGAPPLLGLCAVLFASFAWAFGSLFGKHSAHPSSLWMTSALQMMTGGCLLLVVGFALGEPARLTRSAFTPAAIESIVYLIVFGSWLGFGSYTYLLNRVAPASLGTYAFVNPLVAVLLGVGLLSEPLTPSLGWAALLILSGVIVVQLPIQRLTTWLQRN
jgi:drug/metabolite transporter (DMT)-like permease